MDTKNIESNKQKITFLFSGQSRTFPFCHDSTLISNNILDSYNRFIFTEKFKELYDYKIYITTDDIHLQYTIDYFSKNNIGNIHLLNTSFYLFDIENKLGNIDEHLEKYNNNDWSKHQKYENSIHQHYKIMDCYNLFANDINSKKPDYVVRLRMDTQFTMNIIDMIDNLNNHPEHEILMDWDFFAIGKPNIMNCYCNGLKNNYGKYNFNTIVPNNLPLMFDYHYIERHRWTYAPERQLFEMLFEYCNKNNLDINSVIKSIHCCFVFRQ
jgi:hypothetical protein